MSEALREALTRIFPTFERLLEGRVFTADKAGEVGADMATIKAALATQPAPAAQT